MRTYVISLLLFFCTAAGMAQPVIEDGFEDGNFTENPVWSGDIQEFTVTDGEPNYLLQLQGNPSGGSSFLSTPSTATVGSWEFYYRYDASSAPSASNKASIFLMSDRAGLEDDVNGYALQVGRTGDDTFELVRYDDGSATAPILADTTTIYHNATGYRVRVSRSAGGLWQLEVGSGYSGQLFDSGETAIDNTHTTSSYFGVLVNYTSTRASQFFFDFKIDLPPFTMTGATILDNRTIVITFNREIDASGISPDNFSLDNGAGPPTSVTPTSPNQLQLSFNNTLPSRAYTLTVTGVRDMSGNTLEPGGVMFFVPGEAADGDVLISEFMYDPPSGLSEYVEIRNTSDKYLDLSQWEIGDEISTVSLGEEEILLDPNGFLVLSADTLSLNRIFGHRPYHLLSLPSLNNTGDAIRLIDQTGRMADSLSYDRTWGGVGIAVERRATSVPAIYEENWGDTPNGEGSPGLPNEIPADVAPPVVEHITVINERVLQLIFSERLSEEPALNPVHYQFTPGRAIETLAVRKDTVTLTLLEPLAPDVSYILTISSIADIFGNIAPPWVRDVQYISYGVPTYKDIVINEILYKPGENAAEFVELYNSSTTNIDLSNWKLSDAISSVSLPDGVTLGPDSYLILTGSAIFGSAHRSVVLPGFPSLNDAGDVVNLANTQGDIIDSLRYAGTWGGNREGHSLERKDPRAASSDAHNWKTSSAPSGHTAGGENAAYERDILPPSLTFSKILPSGHLKAHFNEFIRITSNTRFWGEEEALAVHKFDSTNANRIWLEHTNPQGKLTVTSLSAENISDIAGNYRPVTEIPVAHPVKPADLVVNEIMYRPLTDPDDNQPDQSEYLELRNTTDYPLSLEGLVLHDAPDEQGTVRPIYPVESVGRWVPPQGHVLIYPATVPEFEQSDVAAFFEMEDVPNSSMLRVDRASLSLASTGDAIYVADSTGATIDSVYYDESWQNPNIHDTRGIALERISPKGSSSHPSNWGSSVTAKGGTPHRENSIHQSPANPSLNRGLSFSPNPFSPDDDGHEDHLFIHYKLSEPDYLIRAEIYDRYGRFIRSLADGLPAGFEGTLIWDGRKSNGGRNNVGIYIVILEAYDSAGGNNKAFKETVVLARRFN